MSPPHDTPDRRGPEFTVLARYVEDVLTITVSGSVDWATHTTLDQELFDHLSAHTAAHVVLDLCTLDFCDCAGVRTLLRAHHLATTQGATCRVRNEQPHIAQLLQWTGATTVLGTDTDTYVTGPR